MNVTTGSNRVHRPGPRNSRDQVTAKCDGVAPQRLHSTDKAATCKACENAVIAEQNAPTAERIAELHPAAVVTVTPVTETTEQSLAMLAVIAAATDTTPYVVPTVLPGQQVRITGGRFAGIETWADEIRDSGWMRITTNSRRGFGVERQNVAPGNWEPVPYVSGLHEFAPTSGGDICVTPCLRPDGTVRPCGDPVKGAIHDPQAYAAYAAELATELEKWAARA